MEKLQKAVSSVKSVYSSEDVQKYFLPLLKQIISLQRKNKTVIIGVQGGQGTGKTTLARFMEKVLVNLNYKVHSFSIDDFYKTNRERKLLREKYPGNHFYHIYRGLPGTHRVKLLKQTLGEIKAGKPFEIPIFDKSLHNAQGDVIKRTIKVKKRQDFIFFEGWCLGLPKVSSKVLIDLCKKNHINLRKLDPTMKDHKIVLNYTKDYQSLWKFIDYFIMLRPESSDLHQKWRYQQARELKKKTEKGMTKKEIDWFVAPYLPFTYLCYDKVKPDIKLLINKKHRIYKVVK